MAVRPPSPRVNTTSWHQRWQRTGRDDSFIALGFIAIPVWLGLVLLYIAGALALVSLQAWLPENTANYFAGSGPAMLGLIDLVRRLRCVEYCSTTALGLEISHPASLLDRLTFRECGWYMPIFNVPLPLWLLGGAITLILVKT